MEKNMNGQRKMASYICQIFIIKNDFNFYLISKKPFIGISYWFKQLTKIAHNYLSTKSRVSYKNCKWYVCWRKRQNKVYSKISQKEFCHY